ncbi:MBL fold metallo-hydrolase [Pseudomaricurvus sp. HS19]|uniref:MBL fold metallo-hydrolase n=1 Tax=Pseudomaricurvus sp. HS19 TaxID=2692626 RepID=UPI00136EC52F|nr:MBL fold metallo-hydrolase [Pseudomaricurvus sp. HS19]MYM64005.1 MBL fold metallo-hydrolase [Pseudomaricurvus sp. HS19]
MTESCIKQSRRRWVLPLLASSLLMPAALCAADANTAADAVVIALGTQGGPQPNPYRAQPAHALQVNGVTYLVDAGNGVARQLAAADIAVEGVKKIFISHNHDDHNADLGTLMGLSWSLNNRDDFDVFGPAGTQEVVDGFLESYSVNAAIRSEDSPLPRFGSFEGDIEVHNIGDAPAAKVIYKDKNVVVSAVENCHYHHDEPIKRAHGEEKSYAFRFETATRTVVFSGDTGPCQSLVEFTKGADLLVHEVMSSELMADNIRSHGLMAALPDFLMDKLMTKSAQYHTVPEEVGKLAKAAGVGEVVLTHVMPGRKSDPDSAYIDGVSLHYTGKVVVAQDLGRY